VRHWEGAEDIGRTVAYLERAAQRSLRSYANREAIRYVEKALRLQPAAPDASRFVWESILGDAHSELAEYDIAVAHYERALTFARERVAGSASARAQSGAQSRRAVAASTPADNSGATYGRSAGTLRACRPYPRTSRGAALLPERIRSGPGRDAGRAQPCGALWRGRGNDQRIQRARAGSRRVGTAQRRKLLSQAGSGTRGKFRPEFRRGARAYLLAAVLGYGTGEWELTERCADRSLSLFRELGDPARTHAPLTVQLFSAILRGELARAGALLADLGAATALESTGQGKAWHLAATALVGVLRGDITIEDADRVREATAADLVRADRLLCLGVAASAYHRLEEWSQAARAAREGLSILTETGTVWASYVYGVTGIVDVLFDPACSATSASDENSAALRTAIRHARRATRASPVCRPQALLMRGRLAHLSGRRAKAREMWEKAAACADRLQMRREHGLALLEMGRAAAPSDRSGAKLLLRASEIFETIGAFSDLQATRQALRLN